MQLAERVEVVLCQSPAEAAAGSNLILMASGAYEPLVTLDMIRPDTTIIGIEGFRDLDPRIGKRAEKWYLGYKRPDAYILKSPNLNPKGFLADADVYGDMTELLTGRVAGREREDEIIVSTHMGMGAHDVNCAAVVYGEPYRRVYSRSGSSSNYGKFERTGTQSSDGRRYPGNVLFVPTVTGGIHPTQKPVELCQYFIKTYTSKGEVVSDICAGPGTTAVAAINTGRCYLCFENAPAFFGSAVQRIDEARLAVAGGGKGV